MSETMHIVVGTQLRECVVSIVVTNHIIVVKRNRTVRRSQAITNCPACHEQWN